MQCTALMVVDASRIRRQARTAFKRARTTFVKAERELEVYETEDKREFDRWYHSTFGAQTSQLKSLEGQIRELTQTMARLARFVELSGCAPHEAAELHERSPETFATRERELLEQQERKEAEHQLQMKMEHEERLRELLGAFGEFLEAQVEWMGAQRAQDWSGADILRELVDQFAELHWLDPAVLQEAFSLPEGAELLKRFDLEITSDTFSDFTLGDAADPELMFEELFGEMFRELGKQEEEQGPPPRRRESRSDVVSLYRKLAFALHPDQSDSSSDPAKMELWHQVQEAFAARDLDRLEVLYAQCQVLVDGGVDAVASVSTVQALTAMYRQSRNALRRRIRALRKRPDWGFSTLADERRKTLQRRMRRALNADIQSSRDELDHLRYLYKHHFRKPSRRGGSDRRPVELFFEDLF